MIRVESVSSRGHLKIAVDENMKDAVPFLAEKGYRCVFPTEGMSDEQVCNWLKKEGIKVFFTKNYKHFANVYCGSQIYGLLGGWKGEVLAENIELIMMYSYPHAVDKSGHYLPVSQEYLTKLVLLRKKQKNFHTAIKA